MTISGVFSGRHTSQIYAIVYLRFEKNLIKKFQNMFFHLEFSRNCREGFKIMDELYTFPGTRGDVARRRGGRRSPGSQAVLAPALSRLYL